MGRTKKAGNKQIKTRRNNLKKEEDLEDLYSESETGSETDTDAGSDTDEDGNEISLSKELDNMFVGSFDNIKDYDITMPVFGIGLSLIALGFAIYKMSDK